jgi:polyisoprenoid-binding protein YceI
MAGSTFVEQKNNRMAEITTTKWSIDPGHSLVQFKVRHLGISNIAGTFKLFEGGVLSGTDDFDNAKVHCVINTGSIDTNNAQRDEHLKSDIFFDVQKFPVIVFDGLLKKKNDKYELAGDLTIRDTTHHIALDAEFNGTGIGRFSPQKRAGFEAAGKLSRKDYGLSWSMLTEAGGIIVSDEIKLHFDIQLINQ